ncbi:MAG TPA: thiolase family protein [Deltaproteobacteria bacterium]|jgi:acetyl-CoA acetyltransferase|nr:thiolase family protein [Deltaproteobacteria bacterium]HOI05738.1 thiolase family protein [Deltaproteobacteria bacterium]
MNFQDVYVVGAHTVRFGKHLDKGIKDLTSMTLSGCLLDAGIEKAQIQAAWFSNSGWGDRGQTSIRGQVALRPSGIDTIPITNVENACASGSTAFHHAWLGVASGLYDVTLAIGAEKLYHENRLLVFSGFLGGIDIENVLPIVASLTDFKLTDEDRAVMEQFRSRYRASSPSPVKGRKEKEGVWKRLRDRLALAVLMGEKLGYDTTWKLFRMNTGDHSPFMDVYGYAARQHMKRYGSTVEQLAAIASKNHFNGSLNPNAQYRFEVPEDRVLADRIVSWPLTRAMCAPIGDGAASAILCSKKAVRRYGLMSQAVRVRASILGSGRKASFDSDIPEIGERLAQQAYERAGVGPEDIDFAEVHDATAFGELCQVENLGFCPRGEGGLFAQRGATRLDGSKPVNTSGGLISRGHPIGASGLGQIHELVTQLRGRAGKRQVPGARLGMAENGGGALGAEEAAMCMHILEAPSL